MHGHSACLPWRVEESLPALFPAASTPTTHPPFQILPRHSHPSTIHSHHRKAHDGHSERSKPTLFFLLRSREGVGLRSRGISPPLFSTPRRKVCSGKLQARAFAILPRARLLRDADAVVATSTQVPEAIAWGRQLSVSQPRSTL
jgi:hypothetical protein